jgi:hypothetical protein
MRATILRIPVAAFTAIVVLLMLAGELLVPDPNADNLFAYTVSTACALPFVFPWPRTPTKSGSIVLFTLTGVAVALVTAIARYVMTWFFTPTVRDLNRTVSRIPHVVGQPVAGDRGRGAPSHLQYKSVALTTLHLFARRAQTVVHDVVSRADFVPERVHR